MSVIESRREFNRFQATEMTERQYSYTSKILHNQKNFPHGVDDDLVRDLLRTSRSIHIFASDANGIRVASHKDKVERLELQKKAIRNCRRMIGLIELTRTTFHTPNKRRVYWMRQVKAARKYLEDWNKSDAKRYKDK